MGEKKEPKAREVGVCDRCFMVREFVFLKGGVSKCPAAGYGPPQ